MIPEARNKNREGRMRLAHWLQGMEQRNVFEIVSRGMVGLVGDLSNIHSCLSPFLTLILVACPMLSSSDRF